MTNPHTPRIDVVALAAQVRRGDEAALQQAYGFVFGGPLGKLVLADFARACGVGAILGPGASSEDRHYQAGRHDAALILAASAGLDQAALAVLAVTGVLEGSEADDGHEHGNGDGRSGPGQLVLNDGDLP